MSKFLFPIFLLFAIQPAFAHGGYLPDSEVLAGPMIPIIFSFLYILRFIFFAEENKGFRKFSLILLLSLTMALAVIPYFIAHFSLELSFLSHLIWFFLAILGLIVTISCLRVSIVFVFKKNKLIAKRLALPYFISLFATFVASVILFACFASVIFIILAALLYPMYDGYAFNVFIAALVANGILGIAMVILVKNNEVLSEKLIFSKRK